MREFKRCSRCIMDNIMDNTINFDERGYCNYCIEAASTKDKMYFPNNEGTKKLNAIIDKIKADSKDKKYDCMMGISGGLDSSYLTYLGYTWGLRILAVHIDDGYDTEISKNNIKKLVDATHIDLITIKPDTEQYNDLLKAYMKAGVPNLTAPQDNILFAALLKYARENNIKYFLSGGNFAIEYIAQIALRNIVYPPEDMTNLRAIHKKYGTHPINKLPFISPYSVAFDKYIMGIKTYHPLDYIDYNLDRVLKELTDFCGFEYYGGKHYENILTSYMMQVWLPQRYDVDVRKLYLSNMIVSGQITRDDALDELDKPIIKNKELVNKNVEYIKRNLKMTDDEYNEIMNSPAKQHTAYKTYKIYPLLKVLYTKINGERPHI